MSLKFDEASIDRRAFSPWKFLPANGHAPATVRVRVHRSQVFIGVRSTFQPVRVRACGGALRNPNQPRFIGRQPEARVYTEPPKGEWWQRRVSLSRRPIDKIPSCSRPPSPVLITCISSVRNGSRFRSKYSPDTWPCVSLRASRRSPPLFASRIRIIVLTPWNFPVFEPVNLRDGRINACQLPSFQVRLNLFAAT